MVRNYYTLGDIAVAADIYEEVGPLSPDADDSLATIIEGIIGEFLGSDVVQAEDKTLFHDYIWPSLYDESIMYTDGAELTGADLVKAAKKLGGHLYTWFISSRTTYIPIIRFYNGKINDLMAEVKSTSLSKYNDTPQDGGDFVTDAHVTTATQTETSTEGDTPINRLDEIRKKLRDIYFEWYRNFQKTFVIF